MMVKAGVKPAEALKLQIDIAKTEEQGLQARQGVWKAYYDRLVQLQATATEQMKTKVNELRTLEDSARKQQEAGAQVAVDLNTKLMAAQGKPLTDMQAMKIKNDAIDKQASDASILQGQAKIDALTKLRDMQAALTEATTKQIDVFDWGTGKWVKGTTDVKTAEDQLKESLRAVQNTTESINLESALLILNKQKEIDTNQKWSSELTTAMATAKTEMDSYQAQIEAISTRIAGMERNVAVQIALDDKATAGLTQIKALLDDISIPRTASVNLSTGRSLASEARP